MPKNVLVVDDSLVARMLLVKILDSDPALQVVGTMDNGAKALDFLEKTAVDIVVMDINMPVMDGLEATRRIMQTKALPVVIVSAECNEREHLAMFKALEAGALAFVPKPCSPQGTALDDEIKNLVNTIRLMADVKVVTRYARHVGNTSSAKDASPETFFLLPKQPLRAVAIGVSAGGPLLLQKLLDNLPAKPSFPLFIAQHITAGFSESFVHWLSQSSAWPVHLAQEGLRVHKGHVYVAQGGFDMTVRRNYTLALSTPPLENGFSPSVDTLFTSLLDSYGSTCAGILLTGMGRDGVKSLLAMRARGAVTIAQEKTSCVVYGMPAEAVKVGAAQYVLTPEQITDMLCQVAAM